MRLLRTLSRRKKGIKIYAFQSFNEPPDEFEYSLQFDDDRNSQYLGAL